MLATPGTIPTGEGWSFEVKWDGMRAGAYVDAGGGVRVISRTGRDTTGSFPELAVLAELLPGHTMALDGEIIAPDPDGRPSFSRLQQRIPLRRPGPIARAARDTPVLLILFDVLYADGRSFVDQPYTARRAALEALPSNQSILIPPAFDDRGAAIAFTARNGLEGVVAKRRDSVYTPGRRSPAWIKHRHTSVVTATICGWVSGGPGGTEARALLLAVPDAGGTLRYCGRVGTGLTDRQRRQLGEALTLLSIDVPPLPAAGRAPRVRWVRPLLRCEVETLGTTAAGHLRHPVWRRLAR